MAVVAICESTSAFHAIVACGATKVALEATKQYGDVPSFDKSCFHISSIYINYL